MGRMTVDEFIDFRPAEGTQVVSPARRVLKTHAAAQHAPWSGGATAEGIGRESRVIVVARNPKDVAVSMFHHSRDTPIFGFTGSWHDFFRGLFLPGKVESGCFWEWHAGWWQVHQTLPDRVMWISYEEMKKDPKGVLLDPKPKPTSNCNLIPQGSIRKVARFCDIDASPSVVEAVAAASSFSTMKKTFEAWTPNPEPRTQDPYPTGRWWMPRNAPRGSG